MNCIKFEIVTIQKIVIEDNYSLAQLKELNNQDNFYLQRFGIRNTLIDTPPPSDLHQVVVIPCYNEPDITTSLRSLLNCKPPQKSVEIIVVINNSENANQAILENNRRSIENIKKLQEEALQYPIHIIEELSLPKKHAGVGLARKIGMDEAVRRLEHVDNKQGIIICFDADSSCESNLLIEVEHHFNDHPQSAGCSIHFEHPLEGEDFSQETYDAIINYELHLRYFIQAQKWAGFPHAFQTIGSSMAVRNEVYQKQGGMNRRKAGEDFYFLHKIIPLGNFTELKSTKTIPSPRQSDRVPFGTGKAVKDILLSDAPYLTYSPESFILLRDFLQDVESYYTQEPNLNSHITDFLKNVDFEENLKEIRKQSNTITTFINRFYRWFNGFMVMKYAHFMRDNYYPNIEVDRAAQKILELNQEQHIPKNRKELLERLRTIDLR